MGNTDRVAQNYDGVEVPEKHRKRTPDFRHLLVRDLTNYLIVRGFPRQEARIRADELVDRIDHDLA